jgi:hypothetical protein
MAADPSLAAGAASTPEGSGMALPSLTFSSGPAVAGGETIGGNATSGNFTYTRDAASGSVSSLPQTLIILTVVAVAWFVTRKK